MKHLLQILLVVIVFIGCNQDVPIDDKTLETFLYNESFETNELKAWASYPFWQDAAYDPNMRVNAIIPGDSNLSIVQKVTPYSHVDNYAGAQKKFDIFMMPGSYVKLRYYIKTQLEPEFLKIRLAAGEKGKLDYTIINPETNKWIWINVSYKDFVEQSLNKINNKIKVNALAVLTKFPDADPAMPIYLGIDDVEFKAFRKTHFRFTEPQMIKLSEWKSYISKKHYKYGDMFNLKGSWNLDADSVSLEISSFSERNKIIYRQLLKQKEMEWHADFKLEFQNGLYLATLKAFKNNVKLSKTEFTIFIKPENIGEKHPRLWFDDKESQIIKSKLKTKRFEKLKDEIIKNSKEYRKNYPLDSVFFDLDQFPSEVSSVFGLQNIRPWFKRTYGWQHSIYYNALAYYFFDENEAGNYAKELLVKISSYPFWIHPWWTGRGQHIYYAVGEMAMDFSFSYDLLYKLMSDQNKKQIHRAFNNHVIEKCHNGYVEDDIVICNTSNWIAHNTAGSIMCQAVTDGDDETIIKEPQFTGAILKINEMIQKTFLADGSYGEPFGYYKFTMMSLSKVLPSLKNIYNIDLSNGIRGSYKQNIWASNIKKKKIYDFGDSRENFCPLTNWAWFLDKDKDPLLAWFYNHNKEDETLMDAIYETKNVAMDDPFDENPVKVFKDIGTTVFKSGWGKDDFIFVMRTGAYFNHQHIDQGTFWLSDKGSSFIEERHGSTYYIDPYYESRYTQPIAHSTILIDNNNYSQRIGDPLEFAEGFHDHAFIYHFLDGKDVAFSSGDISKLYWGKVKSIRRNVLYIKPRTILMLDVIEPTDKNVDITLLYQGDYLKNIYADNKNSTIIKDENVLQINHIYPEKLEVKTVETPHYIYTMMKNNPLVKEGMLTVTANTEDKPLIMANLLTTTAADESKNSYQIKDSYVSGVASGKSYIFSINPGEIYNADSFITDALSLTWDNDRIFATIVKSLKKDGKLIIKSEIPFTCEIYGKSIKYYHTKKAEMNIGVENKPSSVMLNGKEITEWKYDEVEGSININLPEGEGTVLIN